MKMFLLRISIVMVLFVISVLIAPKIKHEAQAKEKCCAQIHTDAVWHAK